MTRLQYAFLILLVYSFLGWTGETVYSIIKNRRITNRGVLNGPLCVVYGFCAVAVTFTFRELSGSLVFQFIGCLEICSVIEWCAGKLLEKTKFGRWWDYSDRKWNVDGCICLQYSALWGALSVIGLRYLNPLITTLATAVPERIGKTVLFVLFILTAADACGSLLTLVGIADRFPGLEEINSRLARVSVKLAVWLDGRIRQRLQHAYPKAAGKKEAAAKKNVFASGCGFYKLIMLFFIGAFLGDITETLFCRLTAGVWMNRSSVVGGPFSIVWGLALSFGTLFLYNQRQKSDSYIFIKGTMLGGAYEYFCSVFTEKFFGKVFWNYSNIPFNLGGRINLLYCFFWGITAVIWLKKIYPAFSGWIEKIPVKTGKIITRILIFSMAFDVFLSASALSRYAGREHKIAASNGYEEWIDVHFNDGVMKKLYPSAESVN